VTEMGPNSSKVGSNGFLYGGAAIWTVVHSGWHVQPWVPDVNAGGAGGLRVRTQHKQ
jgi:hypothetical protein